MPLYRITAGANSTIVDITKDLASIINGMQAWDVSAMHDVHIVPSLDGFLRLVDDYETVYVEKA